MGNSTSKNPVLKQQLIALCISDGLDADKCIPVIDEMINSLTRDGFNVNKLLQPNTHKEFIDLIKSVMSRQ